MIQYIELLESEQPYVNSEFLQKEIDLWREKIILLIDFLMKLWFNIRRF